jgi:nucleotide-binding universal stress UspA family protein
MFRKILLPVDGSEHSAKAVPVAAELGRTNESEVVVLHVREHEMMWAADVDIETLPEATELVDEAVRELKDVGVSVRGEVMRAAHGQTPRVILDVARAEGADLIVMGTRGASDWGRVLLGSVTHKVVHLAECPVLIVR